MASSLVQCQYSAICHSSVENMPSRRKLWMWAQTPQWKSLKKFWIGCTFYEHFVSNKIYKGCSVGWLVLVTHLGTCGIIYECAVPYTCAGMQARLNERVPPPHFNSWIKSTALDSLLIFHLILSQRDKCLRHSATIKLCWKSEATGEAQQLLKCSELGYCVISVDAFLRHEIAVSVGWDYM